MVSADGALSVTGGGACLQRRCVEPAAIDEPKTVEEVVAGISAGVRKGAGSGRDADHAVEAIAVLLSIARLPPGHDPGADYGVATAARQRWHLAIIHFILVCSAARWPPRTPHSRTILLHDPYG